MKSRKEQVIDLWRTCFGDPEPFIRLFFEQVYRDEYTLTLEREGRVISALQILPYTLCYYGEMIPVGYICGVSTLPEERGKGYMKQLMAQAESELKSRGLALATLIPAEPWLFDYYAHMGYTTAFDYAWKRYERTEIADAPTNLFLQAERLPNADVSALHAYLDRKLRERPICLLHTATDLKVNLIDFWQSGGGAFTLRDSTKKILGIAFVLHEADSNELLIKEWLTEDEATAKGFAQQLLRYFQAERILIKSPATSAAERHLFAMAYLVDPDTLCQAWLRHHPGSTTMEELRAMPPQLLTQLVLDYPQRAAFMSLMMD